MGTLVEYTWIWFHKIKDATSERIIPHCIKLEVPRKKWEKSVHLSVFAREKQLVHNNAIWQKMQCTFFFRCFPFWHFTNYFWLFPNNLTALNRSHNVTFGSWKNLVIQILYYLNCVSKMFDRKIITYDFRVKQGFGLFWNLWNFKDCGS